MPASRIAETRARGPCGIPDENDVNEKQDVFSILSLSDEPRVSVEEFLEYFPVLAATRVMSGSFSTAPAGGGANLQRPHVVSRENKPVRLEMFIVASFQIKGNSEEDRASAMSSDGTHEVHQLVIISQHHAAFHSRNVVRKEEAECVQVANVPVFVPRAPHPPTRNCSSSM